ncbi:uncharacterized protein LOC114289560 [Camellia sinensis]|uniref:uncharacterized protein LOC114289560 n=1 Tax=Camellia sinensis TaxID=4442 RepID=UPI0010364846|nr:uncharacterized protein LOC114289560 [Camellia sinensis]
MTPHLSLFHNCTPPPFPITVNAANGSCMSGISVGSILSSAMFAVSIPSVLYVPQLSISLLSIGQLDASGFDVIFSSSICFVQDRMSKQQIRTGRSVTDLYVVESLHLDLSFNNLVGELPTFASDNLKYIYLRGNMLNNSALGWFTNISNSFVDISENKFPSLPLPDKSITKNWNLFSCCSNITDMPIEAWGQQDYHCDNKKLKYDHLYINCGGGVASINGTEYEADNETLGGSNFFFILYKE